MIDTVIDKWFSHLRCEFEGGLDEPLEDDVVFYSPSCTRPSGARP